MKRQREYESDGVWRYIFFSGKDIEIILNAWEYLEDYEHSKEGEKHRPRGETYTEEYTSITDALRSFIDLIDSHWEVVELDIRPKDVQPDANFIVYIKKSRGEDITVILAINEIKISRDLSRVREEMRKTFESITKDDPQDRKTAKEDKEEIERKSPKRSSGA